MHDRRVSAQAGSLFISFRAAAERYGVAASNQAAAAMLAASLCHRAGIYATRERWADFVRDCCPRVSSEQREAIWSAAAVAPVRFDYAQQARCLDGVSADDLRKSASRSREPHATAELVGFLRANPDLIEFVDYAAFAGRWQRLCPNQPIPSRQRVAAARATIRRLDSLQAPAARK